MNAFPISICGRNARRLSQNIIETSHHQEEPKAHLGLSIGVDFSIVEEVDTVVPGCLDEILDDCAFLCTSDAVLVRTKSPCMGGDGEQQERTGTAVTNTHVNHPPYENTETLRPVLPRLVNCILPGLKLAGASDDILRVKAVWSWLL